MGGGHLPDGFPVPNPTTSYWQIPPHPLANHRTTPELPIDILYDYVIVGSGISGAGTAYKLLSRDPSLKILMVEARTAASAASGRNGGHCRAGWWLNFIKYRDAHGEEEAIKFEQLEAQNVQDIAELVKEHDIDCDFQDVETADVYTNGRDWEEVLEVWEARKDAYERRGLEQPSKMRLWTGDEASEMLGIKGLLGAVTYPAHTQNPYHLVCRLLELCLAKGLHLQTTTPALAVKLDTQSTTENRPWTVQTDRGTVKGKRVVLATNAYTPALHPGIRDTGFLNPARSQVSAVKPKTRSLLQPPHPALHNSVGLNDRGSGDYFMIRAPGLKGSGDLLFGGGRYISKTRERGITDDSKVHEEIEQYLNASAAEILGEQAWGEGTTRVLSWSGITCYTPDTFPLVGEVPGEKGLFASVAMNGHGMAMAWRSAEALVEIMTTGKEPSWFPKSFRIARAWKKSKEDAELKPLAVE